MDNIPLADVIDKADYVRPSIPSALLSHHSSNNHYTPFEVLHPLLCPPCPAVTYYIPCSWL